MNKAMKGSNAPNALSQLTAYELSPERLKQFFADLHVYFLPERLTHFLASYQKLQAEAPPHEPKPREEIPQTNSIALGDFFRTFGPQYEALKTQGAFIDLWEVASLGRDERRNTSVLAWFLNPMASHGFGAGIFHAWMNSLPLPTDLSSLMGREPDDYRVSTEVCPLSDQTNRFDIEIDGKDFYLCIEVKIGSGEGKEQLDRYLSVTEKRALRRKWALVYLTPGSSLPNTAESEKIVPAAWEGISRAIQAHSAWEKWAQRPLPFQLLKQFLRRCEQF